MHVSHVAAGEGGSGLRKVCFVIWPDEKTLCGLKPRGGASGVNYCTTCMTELKRLKAALAEVQADGR